MNAIVALGKSSKNLYINKINYYLSKVGKNFETELINFDFISQKKNRSLIKFINKIAKTYDLANRVLSLGIDTIWRKKACNKAFFL